MSTKNFSLVGIADNVQFGKDGGRLVENAGNFTLRNANDSANTSLTAEDVTLTGELLAAAGSAVAPSISFSGDTNTGLYSAAADVLGFSTNGTERLTLRDPGSANAVATFTGTSAVTLPSGDNGTRPSTPVAGMIRYNTTSGAFEYRNASAWVTVAGVNNEFADNVFRIFDDGDATKLLAFEVSAITTGTTRTVTMVDRNITLDTITVGTTATNANAGSILFSTGTVVQQDNANLFWDDANNRLGVGTNTPTNRVDINGNIGLLAEGEVRFYDTDNSNYVAFKSGATVASNVTWTLPTVDGSAGQSLTTNGAGTLSWATVTTPNASRTLRVAIDQTATGPNNLGAALPAGARVLSVRVQITTPWSSGATLTVGSTGAPAELMAAADIDELYVGFSEKNMDVDPLADQLTYSNSATGTGVGVVVVKYIV